MPPPVERGVDHRDKRIAGARYIRETLFVEPDAIDHVGGAIPAEISGLYECAPIIGDNGDKTINIPLAVWLDNGTHIGAPQIGTVRPTAHIDVIVQRVQRQHKGGIRTAAANITAEKYILDIRESVSAIRHPDRPRQNAG